MRSTAKPPFPGQLDHAARQARAEAGARQRREQFQQQNGFQGSLEVYRAALARWPNDWQIRFNYGNLPSDFRDPAGAAAEYAVAVKLMPVFLPLRIALAQALWDTGRHEQAREEVIEALRQAPDFAPAREALAQMRQR